MTNKTLEQHIDDLHTELRNFIADVEAQDKERGRKLRQLQWRVDNDLRQYKDPVSRMNRMVELFWEGVAKFQGVLGRP